MGRTTEDPASYRQREHLIFGLSHADQVERHRELLRRCEAKTREHSIALGITPRPHDVAVKGEPVLEVCPQKHPGHHFSPDREMETTIGCPAVAEYRPTVLSPSKQGTLDGQLQTRFGNVHEPTGKVRVVGQDDLVRRQAPVSNSSSRATLHPPEPRSEQKRRQTKNVSSTFPDRRIALYAPFRDAEAPR